MSQLNGGRDKSDLSRRFGALAALKLNINMMRGNPDLKQLDLSFRLQKMTEVHSASGLDCRNYGGDLEGLPEARELFAPLLGATPEETIVADNSSLRLMHDVIARARRKGVPGDAKNWRGRCAFICPTPGYDRHHYICEEHDIEMIPVPITVAGLNMTRIRQLVESQHVTGIWWMPYYSNPSGVTSFPQIFRELASMETANPGFRIFCDQAYVVHDLTETSQTLPSILRLCEEAGNPDRVFVFGSTSKITLASAGLGLLATSQNNLNWFIDGLRVQTIGPNKLNQLHHVLLLKDMAGIRAHMVKHRIILKPKFDAVQKVLKDRLGGKGIASWSNPQGGYFVSLWVKDGCATKVVARAGELGVKLTPAGAAFPYGKDPQDSHIRIAPTYLRESDVRQAMEVVALCVEMEAS